MGKFFWILMLGPPLLNYLFALLWRERTEVRAQSQTQPSPATGEGK